MGIVSLWGVDAANESTLFVVLVSMPGASWCGTVVVVQRIFGVELVPTDDVAVLGEPTFLFEAVDGSIVPLLLEPILRMLGGGGLVIVSM